MKPKFYCYVDETGQDTRGNVFIVSVVVSADERDELRRICEAIERQTGKNRMKWTDAAFGRRLAYIRRVLETAVIRGKLNFAAYRNSRDYATMTIATISSALTITDDLDYEATIFIDALPRTLERQVGLKLRRLGIHAKKVRGVRKDESDALIRLADAVCGFVRGALEGEPALSGLFKEAVATGVIRDVSQK